MEKMYIKYVPQNSIQVAVKARSNEMSQDDYHGRSGYLSSHLAAICDRGTTTRLEVALWAVGGGTTFLCSFPPFFTLRM